MQTTKNQITEITYTASYKRGLTKKQMNMYKKLCDEYNTVCWSIVSFQSFLESRINKAITNKHKNLSDLLDIANYAANDF